MSRIQYRAKANPDSSLLHSKMSEMYSRNRGVRNTGLEVVHKYPAEAELIRNGPEFSSSPDIHVLE